MFVSNGCFKFGGGVVTVHAFNGSIKILNPSQLSSLTGSYCAQ